MDNYYNKKRKLILERLDKGEKVSIAELGMYDLTPYFQDDDFDTSLYEKIMLSRNDGRKVEHLKEEIYFSPPQAEALERISSKSRIILSAPTSFGKTLLVKEYIYKTKPNKVIYIVPTNALAYELERSFKENKNFSDYTIYDKCSSYKLEKGILYDEKLLFIGTQEKYLEIDQTTLDNIDLFVIDEAYKLQESVKHQRAYKLSRTFLDSIENKSKKIILLTPKAIIEGFEKYHFDVYESNFNAVDKNYTVLKREDFYDSFFEIAQKEKTILFCKSPRKINDFYESIKNDVDYRNDTNFARLLENEFHPDWNVVKLLKAGILTHHGQMPKYVQNKMINLFNNDDSYKVLIGTNSISEGINTVTKNLFIAPESEKLNLMLLKNTIGRAGRLGKYPIGHIYSCDEIDNMVEEEITLTLAIDQDEELAEIRDSKDINKIEEFSKKYGFEETFTKQLIEKYKISLNLLEKIMTALSKNKKYDSITNLPYMANEVFREDYSVNLEYETILIKGYLQKYYSPNPTERVYLNTLDDRIRFFNTKSKIKLSNAEIINLYMQFIYSTLEYNIMPIVNIGLEIYDYYPHLIYGKNVIESLKACKDKYCRVTYGNLKIDELSDEYISIINAMKDYGMTKSLKHINKEILAEINQKLNIRYSTYDVIKTILKLSEESDKNKGFYLELKRKYLF